MSKRMKRQLRHLSSIMHHAHHLYAPSLSCTRAEALAPAHCKLLLPPPQEAAEQLRWRTSALRNRESPTPLLKRAVVPQPFPLCNYHCALHMEATQSDLLQTRGLACRTTSTTPRPPRSTKNAAAMRVKPSAAKWAAAAESLQQGGRGRG